MSTKIHNGFSVATSSAIRLMELVNSFRPYVRTEGQKMLNTFLRKTGTAEEPFLTKKKPTGLVARCQCGVIIGAMDYERTERHDAGKMLGTWLHDGCTVEPRFDRTWSVKIEKCRCRRETCGDGGAS